MIRARHLAVTAWCALQCAAVHAQEPERAGVQPLAGTPSRQLVEQKHAFVARLLGDSSEIDRIASSGNPEARESLRKASEVYAGARAALEGGDLRAADAGYNEAIWMIGKARRLVPDTTYRAIEQRFGYDRLASTLDALRRSYRRHLAQLGRTESDDAAWNAVSRLVESARSLRAFDRLEEANRALLEAEQRLLEGFGRMLAGSSIDYTPRFADPAEEFRFELERNRGYRELVPIALAEFRPPYDAAQEVERLLESDRYLNGRARELAERKRYTEALSTIRASTVSLQRALRAAGLVVPERDGTRDTGGGGG